ncbi:VanZ family protein [Paenibacillus hunanensis]|uniref:VanZ family protein n=1 Tax=Paenibacillus hunanensis TaxID=539262 RepID=UPI002A69B5C4|nr:VanZ family protein [Paenibacillus hunanensis]WPP41360.1 VanZ family protein [Paenibacillus hunanensis]
MDIQGILSTLFPLLPKVLVIALVFLGVISLLYMVYRKRGGKRRFSVVQFVAAYLLMMWFGLVMMLTTFSRGANFEGWVNFRLFSGYLSAWNQWSLSEFQLIIFNMMMFMPLGFLLPLLSMRMQRFTPVLVVSLSVTIGIELLQMLSGRGIFELDDIFHNTIGSVAGYLVMQAILSSIAKRKLDFKSTGLALCIPMAFVILFTSALAVYQSKELGNLSIRPAIKQNMTGVDVQLDAKLPEQGQPVALYVNHRIYNLEYGERMAALVQQSFSLQQQEKRVDGMNRIWSFADNSGNPYTFNYNLKDGGWQLYSENREEMRLSKEELTKHRAFYEKWMLDHDILPENTTFSTQDENTLRWDIRKPVDAVAGGETDFANGMVMLMPASTAQGAPSDLFYVMNQNEYVRKVEAISPVQAYAQVLGGDFYVYNNLKKGDRLRIEKYELAYTYDSKGYYQPVYRFIGTVNGEQWETLIPAMSNA